MRTYKAHATRWPASGHLSFGQLPLAFKKACHKYICFSLHDKSATCTTCYISEDTLQYMHPCQCTARPECLVCSHYQWRIQDFPEVGASTLQGAPTYNFPNFPKNCMKLKEFGSPKEGTCIPRAPLDPPLHYD